MIGSSAGSPPTRGQHTWESLRLPLRREAEALLGATEAAVFLTRVQRHLLDLSVPLERVYGAEAESLVGRVVRLALDAAAARPSELRLLDRRREVDPEWFQRARMQGYVCYTERFCATLAQLPSRVDYLAELGVTYLHLMPLLRPRPGENDGGYAVVDFRSVNPALGTMAELSAVAASLRGREISLCIDLVLNHTAREHPWAQGWLAGEEQFADFYTAYPDRELPDAYDATIGSVFPDRAPGNFTWVPTVRGGQGGWVWTTLWRYQWDLNYANPQVTMAMLTEILWLANQGIEVFRMDAVPFLWKRLGGSGQNEPQAHALLQVLHAAVRMAAPAVIFKAEAIVSPDDLVGYLGVHERYRPECELAYHNQLMVQLWSGLATQDARLATVALGRMRPIPAETAWVTYSRCHDDIGWAINDSDAAAVGWEGASHRRFLNDFFAGTFPGSYARGARFGHDERTGDARISGTAAALCGVHSATTPDELASAERRLVLLTAVTHGFGGLPLLYMGDELGLDNDTSYAEDPTLAQDNRWMHRPWMDWDAAADRYDLSTVAGRVFGWTQRIVQVRKTVLALRAGAESAPLHTDDIRVLAWHRRHPRSGHFIGLANFSEQPASVELAALFGLGPTDVVLSSDGGLVVRDGRLVMAGLGFAWLAQE